MDIMSHMEENFIRDKAQSIRDVIRYIGKFKNAVVIIYLDDSLLDSPLFLNHIKDICSVHNAGLKVILVPGANRRINEILDSSGIKWSMHNNCRITGPEAMPLIKMAAFDVSNQIMTALAGEKKAALIGNWVRSRGKGVVDGFDYGTSGEIDKLDVESIKNVLDNGFIPIFPCIGWSVTGKPYNISSIELAQQTAIHLKADKLFYMIPEAKITSDTFNIPGSIGLSPEGTVPAMNLEEVDLFLEKNKLTSVSLPKNSASRLKIFSLLKMAKEACLKDVTRVHVINASQEGSIICEIFSSLGSGTMIYKENYGKIREMVREDASGVLSVMRPFIEQGILLPRTKESILAQMENYIVFEIDGAVRACASLIPYGDGQMEIAGVAVDKGCSHIGIGPKLIEYLKEKAQKQNAKGLFLLTTQTADWFEKLGFKETEISSLPKERQEKWTPQRGSKALRFM